MGLLRKDIITMKATVEQLLHQAVETLRQSGIIPLELAVAVNVERAKDPLHGDYTTNLALILAKPCALSPRALAELLVTELAHHASFEQVTVAGPGFINFFMRQDARAEVIATVLKEGSRFGCSSIGAQQKVLLEFVSANPTGPLHVGHGRGAAFGATLANVLTAAGYDVCREYYVNDAGRQMNILAVSVWLRYLMLADEPVVFPANAYRGDYVHDIAKRCWSEVDAKYVHPWSVITKGLPLDEPDGGDKERYIDALIERAQTLLGLPGFSYFHRSALESVLTDIKDDLAIEALKNANHTYEHEGALWFRATAFGDEKDRVLLRANGQPTYFASDVAYHWNKYERGFASVIDVFGADHHGYVTRIKSAVRALGHNDDALTVLLVQFAILYRGGERVQMSTRSGSFVTLRELREEVGNDAARFFYVMRKPEQHMDFDLDLAKAESNDNPVYYIQYAHARICSVLRQLVDRGLRFDVAQGLLHVNQLTEPQEVALVSLLSRYPEVIASAAKTCEPHMVAYYLRELATGLHSYYNAVPLLCEEETLRFARLCLLTAVRHVLCNGLQMLGVSAPESM